jgi:molybdate transport system substrate-binding protein
MPVTIRILSAGAPKLGVGRCAEAFTRNTGNEVGIAFATAPVLRERVEGGEAAADLLVAPVALVKDFTAACLVGDGTAVTIGSVTAGVAVRQGAAIPDISSVDALVTALLGADAVLYNEASSGQYIAGMIERLGIAGQVEARTERLPTGAAVMKRLAGGKAPCEIGFGQITEIRRFEGEGVTLVGPLPAEVGKKTDYAACLLAGAAETQPAQALLAFMDSAEARRIYAEAGLEAAD